MNLRKFVKAPKRYEPELDDAPHEERYMPTVKKPLFRAPVIEYNPYLPPAAFPTLDKPRPDLSETPKCTSELGSLNPNQPLSKNVEPRHSKPADQSGLGNEIRGQSDSRLFSSPVRHLEPATIRHEASMNLSIRPCSTYSRNVSSFGPYSIDMLQTIQNEMETSEEENRPSPLTTSTRKASSFCLLPDYLLTALTAQIINGETLPVMERPFTSPPP